MHGDDTRPWTFYAFAAFFTLFVLFLYGQMIVIYILSFQGPNGGMTFPLNGVSLHWFNALISQTRVGDIAGSFVRSIGLAAIVAVVTVVLSVLALLMARHPPTMLARPPAAAAMIHPHFPMPAPDL